MQLSKKKNTIVLKGMASNVVDEAIVVLKPNIKFKQSSEKSNGEDYWLEKDKKMVVLKEAENTINIYLKKLEKENKKSNDKKLILKYNFLKACNIMLIFTILTIALVLM